MRDLRWGMRRSGYDVTCRQSGFWCSKALQAYSPIRLLERMIELSLYAEEKLKSG